MSANAVISSIWQPFNRMNSRKLICLAALAIALQSCRTGPPKIQTPFNPLSVGPTGPTLKKFLDRGVSLREHAVRSAHHPFGTGATRARRKRLDVLDQHRRQVCDEIPDVIDPAPADLGGHSHIARERFEGQGAQQPLRSGQSEGMQ